MKFARTLIVLTALATPSAAHAAAVFGFIDSTRVYAEATEPKRLLADVARDFQAKQREVQSAQQAVETARTKKAKPADIATLEDNARKLSALDQADYDKHRKEIDATLRKHLAAVCDKLRAEKHLFHILGQLPLDTAPDLTDEAIKRWNTADADGIAAKAVADANARADAAEKRAREAEAKMADGAALTKPAAPSIPPPPPIQPLAVKVRK